MPNLQSLGQLSSRAKTLSDLIVVAPSASGSYQPQVKPIDGIDTSTIPPPPKLLFNYEGEQSIMLESDITDHFVEDNRAIQDQIALRPLRIQVKGFVGELNDIPPAAPELFKFIQDKLVLLGPFTPQLTVTALQAYQTAFALYQTAAAAATAAVSAWATVDNIVAESGFGTGILNENITGLNRNKQQIMFQTFFGYWSQRYLFTVQTPWTIYRDMAIQTFRAVQDESTRVISDFEITFKQIRFASTLVEDLPTALERAKAQTSPVQDNGTTTPAAAETNIFESIARVV